MKKRRQEENRWVDQVCIGIRRHNMDDDELDALTLTQPNPAICAGKIPCLI